MIAAACAWVFHIGAPMLQCPVPKHAPNIIGAIDHAHALHTHLRRMK